MNKEVFFNEEAALLMLKMRSMIYREFNVLLSMHSDEAIQEFCGYGLRSQQPTLNKMTQQLSTLLGVAALTTATTDKISATSEIKSAPSHRQRIYRGHMIND